MTPTSLTSTLRPAAFTFVLSGLGLSLLSGVAAADEPVLIGGEPADPNDVAIKDTAAELHDEARAALRDEDFPKCHAKSKAAWAIHHHPQIAAIRADCGQRTGQHLDAVQFAQVALQRFGESGPIPDRMREVLSQSGPMLGRLQVSLTPEDARLLVDGEPATVDPDGNVYLSPGRHTIGATREGHASQEKTLEAVAGQEAAITLTLPSLSASPAPNPPPGNGPAPGEQRYVPVWVPITLGIVAAGSFGGAIATHLLHDAAVDDADGFRAQVREEAGPNGCLSGSPPAACSDLENAVSDAESFRGPAQGLYVLAGIMTLATIGAAVAAATGPSSPDETGGVDIVPYAGLTEAGVQLSITW